MSMDITTDQGFKELTLLRHQAKLASKPLFVHIGPAPEKTITQRQVNALNLWCRQVAECLQEAGLDMKQIISVEIPATEYLVKNNLYKAVLESQTGKRSTMDQSTIEPSHIAEILARHFAQKYNVVLPFWPSRGQE